MHHTKFEYYHILYDGLTVKSKLFIFWLKND